MVLYSTRDKVVVLSKYECHLPLSNYFTQWVFNLAHLRSCLPLRQICCQVCGCRQGMCLSLESFAPRLLSHPKAYKLGDPADKATNLGPVVSVASATRIRKQVADAVKAGAKPLIPEELFSIAKEGTAYVAPQVLVNVNHSTFLS
jgi:hypothetical protein